ncbi:M15 family metallopeptidase [Krasilnikoviella flava]|uniref:D-alanyl-D-alanine carboxypeptidase n=1 Tax=Krasilnikoviella flava TaxID=526729 RepID=A0A1T5K0E5_9MICO|nr:M15 family metallopeptidase [Krasilnikoviella flava]SKC56968.1 D-alanyl-D-alanine carboxypeptidase [Krasilnikoviella flava]
MPPRVPVTVLQRFRGAAVVGALAIAGTVAPGAVAHAALPDPRPGGESVLSRTWTPALDPADPLVLVNKAHPVSPAGWAPDDLVRPDVTALGEHDRLRADAARALERLAAAAEDATGHELVLASGYRSADYQRRLYARYVDAHGRRAADTFSARPGFSEHQTGLAADVAEAGTSYTRFGRTETGRWVADQAWRYGFVVRYPKGEQAVTGYSPEPWHLRYVGTALTTFMHLADTPTLEEAFGAAPAPDYAPTGG